MKKYLINSSIVILIVFMLAACGGAATPTESPEVLMTSAVGSMVASFFGTQTAMYTPPPMSAITNTPLPSPTVIYRTSTVGPTLTPTFIYYSATPTRGTATPTGTLPTPTVNSASLAVGCNNLGFVRDVTVPNGTVMQGGQAFTKTWKVQNTGTCDWAFNYTLVHVGGDSFDGETERIKKKVPVWSWSEVTVQMGAPKKPGTYTSSWRLSNGQALFGATLTVSIVVQDVVPTAVPPTAYP